MSLGGLKILFSLKSSSIDLKISYYSEDLLSFHPLIHGFWSAINLTGIESVKYSNIITYFNSFIQPTNLY